MTALEQHLNQHLLMLRLVERAVHRPTNWTLRVDGVHQPLQVVVSDVAVSFWAVIPPCATPSVMVDVYQGDDHLWTRTIEVPEGCASELEWTFSPDQKLSEAAA